MRVGAQKGADKLGYEAEAFAIYDTMKYIKPAVHTLCVGTAFGESAMLLAAGTPVRAAHLACTHSCTIICSIIALCTASLAEQQLINMAVVSLVLPAAAGGISGIPAARGRGVLQL
jgi:hypothetical protein